MNIFKQLLELIYPAFCQICDLKLNSEEEYLCHKCLYPIRISPSPFYPKSYKYLQEVWSWAIYENIMKKCIHLVKYKQKDYIFNLFKKPLIEFFERNSIMKNVDIITFVPLYSSKLRERTFNQAEIIAKVPASYYEIPLRNLLQKTIKTLPQHNFDKYKRIENVKGSFTVEDKEIIRKRKILIVDDILTTGATINECSKVLLEAGAKKVYGFTLLRGG